MGAGVDDGCVRKELAAAHHRQRRRHLGQHDGGGHLLQGIVDPSGTPLTGDCAYHLRLRKEQLPESNATYFWSVIAVDSAYRRVLPNPLKRYLLNKETNPQYGQDGSLTLYFADSKPTEAPDGN